MNRARSPPTDAADLSRGCNLNKGKNEYIVKSVKNNLYLKKMLKNHILNVI